MSQENQNLHDTAALRALASGELLNSDENPPFVPSTDAPPADVSNTVLPGSGGQYVPQADPSQSPAPAANPTSRNIFSNGGTTNSRAAASRAASRQNVHAGIHFRKTIIPLLLVMAIVLVALGVFTLMKVNSSSPEVIAKNPILDNGTLFAGVTITLGLCLIAGSLFFHYEVKKHHRENGGGKK